MQMAPVETILVFVALPEEHDRFLEFFPSKQAFTDSAHLYVEHATAGDAIRVISVLASGMGNDNAFDATAAGIKRFNPNLIVCVGIAGSLTSDLKLGDVSVSSEIIDISQNMKISEVAASKRKRPARRGKAPRPAATKTVVELSPKPLPVMAELSASFRFLRSHPTLKEELAQWTRDATTRRTHLIGDVSNSDIADDLSRPPAAEIGPIISGPVVASSAFKETLKKLDRKVLSVETESSGVFRAALAAAVPCITIRGISDHADINKNALERTTKQAARQLAADNAIAYFSLQIKNESFLRVASTHLGSTTQQNLFGDKDSGPDAIMRRVSSSIGAYLEKMSPEYKHRPNNANLPIPRISRDVIDEDIEELKPKGPQTIAEAIAESRGLYIKIPKSYPNQTLAWSIGQALLRGEIDGKQVLPLVVSGDEINPPSKGIKHATGVDPADPAIQRDFTPVIIVSEPHFHSAPRMQEVTDELKAYAFCPAIVVSRAETPTEKIDKLKTDLALVDHQTAPVPFYEIADYLETAFEMQPAEADSVATRLDDTFSKFRLHTHPAYFVGLQEATIDALIAANHRAELIQLAVDGLLSFVVAFDESPVKLTRTTREEFLSDLAYKIRVEGANFSRIELYAYAEEFGRRKALEVLPEEFLRGFFSVGLLHEASGKVSFSLSFLEAYLLSERLKTDNESATKYFEPSRVDFDQYAFDLYVERGACIDVVEAVCSYANTALAECGDDENVFLTRKVKPRALSSSQMLLQLAQQMSETAVRLSETSGSKDVRLEKQRIIDARTVVRGKVAARDSRASDSLPAETKRKFARLDALSRSSTLLATIIGSGAERLDGEIKAKVGSLLLSVCERFLHHWTVDRMTINFNEMREELKAEGAVEKIIEELGLYEDDVDAVRASMLLFLDDQELKLLSGPSGVVFMRLAQYAGVRSLRPTFASLKPTNEIERLLRDVWLMDVEHNDGKRALKNTLQHYKGSQLLRLTVTNHLMNRIFWHHWQRDSRAAFVDVAKYSLAPLGLRPADEHTQRMLSGPKR